MIQPVAPLPEILDENSVERGFGALQTARGCLPLVALEVQANLVALSSEVRVRQTFCNTLTEPLEATYIFPLPERAAVSKFTLTVAGRVVEGLLQERGQARAEYNRAIQAGHRAAIAEEERPGVFTMRVGNLPPGEEAVVDLTLVGPLVYSDDEVTFRFPLVVAQRYIPGNALPGAMVGKGTANDTDQVPDASRISPPVLLPGFKNPVRLSLDVTIDPAGLASADWQQTVRSSLHSVVTETGAPLQIRLQPGERLNRDFILRYKLATPSWQTSLVAHRSAANEPATFCLTVLPPQGFTPAERPRDVVVVLDRSGSMQGWKMIAARRSVGRIIDSLNDRDRFTVIAFDSTLEFPPSGSDLQAATNRNRWQIVEWLGKVEARGGTEMEPALSQAVRLLNTSGNVATQAPRDRVVLFVTDGQVGNEDGLLKALHREAKGSMPRVFTVGIERSVNAGFLQRLADAGGGFFELVESEERLDDVLDRVHRRIGTPLVSDIQVLPTTGELIPDSYDHRGRHLFSGAPLVLFGRATCPGESLQLNVRGTRADGQPWETQIATGPTQTPALLNLWGRDCVRRLEDRYATLVGNARPALAKQIVEVSLFAGVLSRFTSFVAVDKAEIVNAGGKQAEVIQPVEEVAELLCDSSVMYSMAPSQSMPAACCAPASPADSGFFAASMPIAGYAPQPGSMPPPAAMAKRAPADTDKNLQAKMRGGSANIRDLLRSAPSESSWLSELWAKLTYWFTPRTDHSALKQLSVEELRKQLQEKLNLLRAADLEHARNQLGELLFVLHELASRADATTAALYEPVVAAGQKLCGNKATKRLKADATTAFVDQVQNLLTELDRLEPLPVERQFWA